MSGTRIFLGFTALVLVGMLALLWQMFLPRSVSTAGRETPARLGTAPALRPTEPGTNGVRSIYPGPGAPAPSAAQAPPRPDFTITRGSEPAPPSFSDQAASTRPENRTENRTDLPARTPTPRADDAPVAPDTTTPPQTEPPGDTASLAGTDLNTATLQQLNALGAGMIGRTIIANRPYAAPEELLSRRVLNRRDYETIRPHVQAR